MTIGFIQRLHHSTLVITLSPPTITSPRSQKAPKRVFHPNDTNPNEKTKVLQIAMPSVLELMPSLSAEGSLASASRRPLSFAGSLLLVP